MKTIVLILLLAGIAGGQDGQTTNNEYLHDRAGNEPIPHNVNPFLITGQMKDGKIWDGAQWVKIAEPALTVQDYLKAECKYMAVECKDIAKLTVREPQDIPAIKIYEADEATKAICANMHTWVKNICVGLITDRYSCVDKTRILLHDEQTPPKFWCHKPQED